MNTRKQQHGTEKKTKEDVSRDILRQAQEERGIKKFVGLFSGGKDSLTTCHFLWKEGLIDSVLYCNTGISVPENQLYVLDICKRFGWNLNIVQPKEGETYEDFWRKFGPPGPGAHSMVMGYLKWHPMRKWAQQHRNEDFAFVSGRRFKESKRRGGIMGKNVIEQTEKMTFVAPLYHWSDQEVWDYLKDNNLTRCPVYETLHISGDCLCGAFAEPEEAMFLRMFHPTTAERIRLLENAYGGIWGNGMSMNGALKQTQLTDMEGWACQECKYEHNGGVNS